MAEKTGTYLDEGEFPLKGFRTKMLKTAFGNEPKSGECSRCKKHVDPETEFRDQVSKDDYRITLLCQPCQDYVYAEPKE